MTTDPGIVESIEPLWTRASARSDRRLATLSESWPMTQVNYANAARSNHAGMGDDAKTVEGGCIGMTAPDLSSDRFYSSTCSPFGLYVSLGWRPMVARKSLSAFGISPQDWAWAGSPFTTVLSGSPNSSTN